MAKTYYAVYTCTCMDNCWPLPGDLTFIGKLPATGEVWVMANSSIMKGFNKNLHLPPLQYTSTCGSSQG